MAPDSPWIGIDFGTSNSAVAYQDGGATRLVRFDGGAKTLPTTFFFDFDTHETLIGEPANQALLGGVEGRFMRALKRVLGTALMHEKRQILNQRLTFVDIIGTFLRRLRLQAEAELGQPCTRVVAGRPVVFHGDGDSREAQAEADLLACYEAAGFTEVRFCLEPAAAAIANGAAAWDGSTGLVVDIGGGTSDFSVFRARGGGVEVLANLGVRIGGTDFDRAISIDHVMPLLGKGSLIRDVFGTGTSLAPNAIFNDLATWEKIPFLYTAQNRRKAEEMHSLAQSPERLARLVSVLDHELGHELAFAVERSKIDLNTSQGAIGGAQVVALDMLEKGLAPPLDRAMIQHSLASHADRLRQGASDVMARAGLAPEQLDRVVYVGGSSLMDVVPATMRALFPEADHSFASVFTAVVEGLAAPASRGTA